MKLVLWFKHVGSGVEGAVHLLPPIIAYLRDKGQYFLRETNAFDVLHDLDTFGINLESRFLSVSEKTLVDHEHGHVTMYSS